MLDISSPHFWRNLATYIVGGAFVGLPLLVPVLAPLAIVLQPLGLGMVGLAGTRALMPSAPPLLPAPGRTGTTPPAGTPKS